ncbi:putative transcription factor C2C2-GATA family [Helianthus annuus]|nr:putative transcription factor C2C2-GATA family [Helianthus annuus]
MSLLPVKICMNELCGATTTAQWKRGWPMKVGGVATLCYACGTEYDRVRYCERFHLNEPGWRECKYCDKPVHCGCVVSKYLHECLDSGGISCINCIRAQSLKQPINEIPNGFSRFAGSWLPSIFTNRTNNITPLTDGLEKHQFTSLNSSKDIGSSFKSSSPLSTIFSNQLPLSTEPNNNKPNSGSNSLFEPPAQLSLGFSILPTSNGVAEENTPSFKKEQKSHQVVPKQLKIRSKSNKGMSFGPDNRVGRPPGEGRGRTQLLPRYWPKMTDQELSQIHGDLNSNCTLTPLFEKILSASDAGRIGRLVLPKACAEAYFPPINQSEGVPLKIRDIKGKEWTFQFRFWPNNNSRMYVLEGVTPCIQNMQLQAGDTVIFSRLDPEDKLVIGCRKATVLADAPALPNPVNGGVLTCTNNGNLPTNTTQEGTSNWDSVQSSEIKKTRTIGSKSKRLHMHSEDALELKITWEEAQEYLRPPISKPTVVTIENCELEEYDEPPVFGKKTMFTTNAAQLQEQWVQCDSCSKWRKLPSDVLVPSKWTCSDNVSDPNRCSCSHPEEKGVKHLYRVLKFSKESKKQKIEENMETKQVGPTGLDALATMAVLGENGSEHNESLAGPTTRHPRHRPGCSCIVCIQPPSGKGKHKPNCICNVCATVRRRFKTLMLRKKKRLAEQEIAKSGSEMVQKAPVPAINRTGSSGGAGAGAGPGMMVESSNNKGQEWDLNRDPMEEQMMLPEAASIHPEWQNVLVPKGTSDVKDGPAHANNKVVGGS